MKKLNLLILIQALGASALMTVLTACGTAKITGRQFVSPAPAARPKIVHVVDFDLDAAGIHSTKGFLPSLPAPPGLGDLLPPLPGMKRDPQKEARHLVDEMSKALVQDLRKAGFDARRCSTNVPWPTAGWLVRGVFANVDQGNQLRRAVVGFGAGKTLLQIVVDISELGAGAPRKFYEANTQADSGTAPGAGPTIILGPAGLAARVVIAGKDLDRNVRQTAAKIAAEVSQRTTPPKPAEAAAR